MNAADYLEDAEGFHRKLEASKSAERHQVENELTDKVSQLRALLKGESLLIFDEIELLACAEAGLMASDTLRLLSSHV